MGLLTQSHGIWSSGGGPWTPINLPNLQLWTRGSDLFTPGGAYTWGDKSGNGNDLTNGGGGASPSVAVADLNGEDTLLMASPAVLQNTLAGLTDPTMWIIWKPNDATTNGTMYLDNIGIQFLNSLGGPPNGSIRVLGGTIGAYVPSPLTLDYRMLRVSLNNGTAPDTVIEWGDQGEVATPFTKSAPSSLFDTNNLIGYVAEIVIMDGTPNVLNIQKMKDYIVARYGITM